MRWQFVADSPSVAAFELVDASSRRVTWRLKGAADATFVMNGRGPHAGDIAELTSDVHVYVDGRKLFRGRVGPTNDSLAETHVVTVNAADYRALLQRRIFYSDSTLVFTGDDQAEIAWQLIVDTQARAGGDLGITQGFGAITGVTRDRTFEAGKSIGEALEQLGAVIDGFDWEIDADLVLNVFYPERGQNLGVVLDYGGLVRTVQRGVDPSAFHNALRFNGGGATTAVEIEAAGIGAAPEGRWDRQLGQTDLVDQSAVDERADGLLDQGQIVSPSYIVTLKPDAWKGPDHIWLGDTVKLRVRSLPRLDVLAELRVYEISAAIDENDQATMTLAIGAPPPDFTRRFPDLSQRLDNLERR